MKHLDNKQLEMDLKQCLAHISSYHPNSHSTQVLISAAMKCVTELAARIKESIAHAKICYDNGFEDGYNEDFAKKADNYEAIIESMKCCGNCGTTSKYIVCQSCIRYDGFTKDDLVDRWSGKGEIK